MEKNKTYLDKLMTNNEFRQKFEQEYRNLCIAEQIARAPSCAFDTGGAGEANPYNEIGNFPV